MPIFGEDSITNTLKKALSHLQNAGSFNEGGPGQVSGDSLPPDVKARVDQLASHRDSLGTVEGPEGQAYKQHLQDAINFLYNPKTRAGAMSSWAQLHGDENDSFSATGGRLGGAASIVNSMTTDPDHHLYGGRRK